MAGIESRGFGPPDCIAGTSAGAIIAACRAAGYSPAEMRLITSDTDFRQFKHGARWGTHLYHIVKDYGVYDSTRFYEWIKSLLEAKGVRTFRDLRSGETDSRWRYRCKVVVSDISSGRMITFPDDAHLYGVNPDDLEVASAVRMSMSIPGFFRPTMFNNNYMVDGGLLSNFPIWIFDSDEAPTWPTFGIILKEPDSGDPHKVKGVFSYMNAIFKTLLVAHDRKNITVEDYFHRLMQVPVGTVKTTDFNLSGTQKDTLYRSGFTTSLDFLENWSWPRYRKWAAKLRGCDV